MGKRLSRKDIKKSDPVMERLLAFGSYIWSHQKLFLVALVAVVLVVLGTWGFRMFSARSAMARAAALDKAMESFTLVEAISAEETHTTEEMNAKLNAAYKALDQVAKTYPSTLEGDTAFILSATCLRRLGKLAEAEAVLRQVLPSIPEGQMKQIAKMSLAETLRLEKKFDEALKLIDEIEKAATPMLDRDTLQIEKSVLLEEAGKIEEAYKILSDIVKTLEKAKPNEDVSASQQALPGLRARMENLKTQLLEKGLKVS